MAKRDVYVRLTRSDIGIEHKHKHRWNNDEESDESEWSLAEDNSHEDMDKRPIRALSTSNNGPVNESDNNEDDMSHNTDENHEEHSIELLSSKLTAVTFGLKKAVNKFRTGLRSRQAKRISKSVLRQRERLSKFLSGVDETYDIASEGVLIAYLNLSQTISPTQTSQCRDSTTRDVLCDLSGCILPGSFTIIVGLCQSGKSTLLQTLNGIDQFAFKHDMRGTMQYFVNGVPVEDNLRTIIAYVPRKEVLLDSSTVKEVLEFSSRFRVDYATEQLRQDDIDMILRTFHLRVLIDTSIRKLSNSQLHRLAIAMDAIASPGLFLLDDPATNLDLFGSKILFKVLQRIAVAGHTIVVAAEHADHQLLEIADEIIILAKGKTMYKGPPSGIVPYFTQIGFTIEAYRNPVRAVLDFLAPPDEFAAHSMQWKHCRLIDKLQHTYRSSELGQSNVESAKRMLNGLYQITTCETRQYSALAHGRRRTSQIAYMLQVWYLFNRFLSDSARAGVAFKLPCFIATLFAVLIAMIWSNSQDSPLPSMLKYTFFLLSSATILVSSRVSSTLKNRQLFLYESERDMYATLTFLVADTMASFIPFGVFSSLFIGMSYWFIHLKPTWNAALFSWAVVTIACSLQSTFLDIVIFESNSASIAGGFMYVLVLWNVLMCGHLVSYTMLPSILRWGYFTSHLQYAFSAIILNEIPTPAMNDEAERLHPLPKFYTSRLIPFACMMVIWFIAKCFCLWVYAYRVRYRRRLSIIGQVPIALSN